MGLATEFFERQMEGFPIKASCVTLMQLVELDPQLAREAARLVRDEPLAIQQTAAVLLAVSMMIAQRARGLHPKRHADYLKVWQTIYAWLAHEETPTGGDDYTTQTEGAATGLVYSLQTKIAQRPELIEKIESIAKALR